MSSVRLVIVTGSVLARLSLRTTTVKVALPPGSSTCVGLAVFVREIAGERSVMDTVASSLPLTEFGGVRLSTPEAVTVSVWRNPAFPVIGASNVQLTVSPAPIDVSSERQALLEMAVFAALRRLPNTVSFRLLMVTVLTGSAESFRIDTVNRTVPPGSLREVGLAVLTTVSVAAGTGISMLNPRSQRHFD